MPAITIRNVPESVRNKLAARAARRGQSLQEFLRAELISSANELTVDELIEQVRPDPESIWKLRQQVSTFDAGYCALAQGSEHLC